MSSLLPPVAAASRSLDPSTFSIEPASVPLPVLSREPASPAVRSTSSPFGPTARARPSVPVQAPVSPEPVETLEISSMHPVGQDEDVRQRTGEGYNAALVRNLLLREPLRPDPQPSVRTAPPVTSSAPVPSTSLCLRSVPISSGMAAVMSAGPTASSALPVSLTPRQIDERRPPLAGGNRAQHDPRWDHLASHSVRRPETVVPARYDRNTHNLRAEIYPPRRYRDRDRLEYNPRPYTVYEYVVKERPTGFLDADRFAYIPEDSKEALNRS